MVSLRYRLFVFSLWALVLLPVLSVAREPISQIEEIRSLSLNMAAQALPVEVEGQVYSYNRSNHNFFLFGEEGVGVYVSWREKEKGLATQFSIGSRVRVTGVVDSGDFSPKIIADSIEVFEVAPLPDAPNIRSVDLYSGSNDCVWYTMTGRIESMKAFPNVSGGSIALKVNVMNQLVSVIVPLSDEELDKADELMFSRIRFKAIAGAQSNADRQFVSRIFFLNSLHDCEVLESFPLKSYVKKPIDKLGRNTGNNFRRFVSTYGWVTHVDGDVVYLRGEEGCLKVSTRGEEAIRVGDYVELNGIVVPGPLSPSFLAHEITQVVNGDEPEPIALELDRDLLDAWKKERDSKYNYELVEMTAELVELTELQSSSSTEKGHILICRAGEHLFNVKAPFDLEAAEDLKPGAILKISGICHLSRNWERTWRMSVEWFYIQPRSPADLVVLRAAPWWTATRLLWLMGTLLGVAVLFIIWTLSLRRTVDKQTAVIAQQVERESIDEERQRIARELHDTLEQTLAALGFLLRSCQSQMSTASDRARETMAKALGLQRSCAEQSRSAITELREEQDRSSLVARISGFSKGLNLPSGGTVSFKIEGDELALEGIVSYYIYRICVEAVNNAIEHSGPSLVLIKLEYLENGLRLHVVDNGCGFEVDRVGDSDRYGLVGMRERAKKIDASLSIESVVGSGTKVALFKQFS